MFLVLFLRPMPTRCLWDFIYLLLAVLTICFCGQCELYTSKPRLDTNDVPIGLIGCILHLWRIAFLHVGLHQSTALRIYAVSLRVHELKRQVDSASASKRPALQAAIQSLETSILPSKVVSLPDEAKVSDRLAEYQGKNVKQLQALCAERGLRKSGARHHLIERLSDADLGSSAGSARLKPNVLAMAGVGVLYQRRLLDVVSLVDVEKDGMVHFRHLRTCMVMLGVTPSVSRMAEFVSEARLLFDDHVPPALVAVYASEQV